MAKYEHNKIKTAWQIFRRIENWPAAFDLRLRRRRPGLRLLRFRDGLNVVCRGGTQDWDVVHELFFAGGYGRAMSFLKGLPGQPLVLDLGGNIGLFSLLAARAHPAAEIFAYEPGPPNHRIFEINRLANATFSERIHLHTEAVGGRTRAAEWFFDDLNPGGSSLFGAGSGTKFAVQIRAFAELINSLAARVQLLKMDIEGAEFELLADTPREVWRRIDAISLELHDDPEKKISRLEFLNRMTDFGFTTEEETVCSYFLHR